MMISGILLHGICYDFFFVTGQIYTNNIAPANLRSQAQSMLVLFTLGFGMMIGAQCAAYIEGMATPEASIEMTDKATALSAEIDDLKEKLNSANESEVSAINQKINAKTQEKDEAAMQALKLKDWRTIWGIPCAFAAVVMILFTIVFKDDAKNNTEQPAEEESQADASESS